MPSPGKKGSSKGGSPVEKRSKGSPGSAGSNKRSRNSTDSPGSAERDKPAKNSPGSPGQKYGVDGDIIEKRNTESLKPSYFENLQNARPARAHVRNRKLKWKEGNSEEGSKTEEESSASSSSLSIYQYVGLTIIALITLYYLYKKLKR
uniref:LPXTG-domain-containing protein cell wall anchor domain n=1 Tax=Haemonchus contortus TaxID=6289 RepID=A0A912MJ90_HAECO